MVNLAKLVKGLLWSAAALAVLYPLLWTFLNSFKATNLEIFEHPFAWPAQWAFSNYGRAMVAGNLSGFFINSILVTALSTAGVVAFGGWAGFTLGRGRIAFRYGWLGLFMLAAALPVQAFLIPLIDLLEKLGLYNNLWGLILAYAAQGLPLAILLFGGFFEALPRELEEIARLDGVSTGRFYLWILLPAAKPAVATVGLLTALSCWNEFLLALLVVTDPALKTVPAGMIAFEQVHNTDYPALLAGLSLASFPVLVAYWIFNRQIIRGVVAGAVK